MLCVLLKFRAFMYVYCKYAWYQYRSEEGIRSRGSGVTEGCGANMWVLGAGVRISVKITSILNHRAISPASFVLM